MNSRIGFIFIAFMVVNIVEAASPKKSTHMACKDVKTIIDIHNKYRSDVSNSGQPKPTDLRGLVWSDDLSSKAQQRANKIASDKLSLELAKQESAGESILITSSVAPSSANWKKVIDGWYKEHEKYKFEKFNPFASTRHYSQLVWANSHFVGCAFREYHQGLKFHQVHICKYDPAGNIAQLFPYETAKACSGACSPVEGVPKYGTRC